MKMQNKYLMPAPPALCADQVLFTPTLYFLVGFQPIASKFFIFLAFVSVAGVSTGAECQLSWSHSEDDQA